MENTVKSNIMNATIAAVALAGLVVLAPPVAHAQPSRPNVGISLTLGDDGYQDTWNCRQIYQRYQIAQDRGNLRSQRRLAARWNRECSRNGYNSFWQPTRPVWQMDNYHGRRHYYKHRQHRHHDRSDNDRQRMN